ncbi:MAG: hypothetical protein AAF944_19760 [Bacteroidota bacterium]
MDLKGLYQIAKKELMPLYDGESIDLRLEQVERDEDSGIWKVVVSYLVEDKNHVIPSAYFKDITSEYRYERIYKLLKVNDDNKVEGLLMFDKAS